MKKKRKKFSPAPVQIPSQRPLSLSVTSVTSVANDKGDNEMNSGAVHRSPGICLRAEGNPVKPQVGDRLMPCCTILLTLPGGWGPHLMR